MRQGLGCVTGLCVWLVTVAAACPTDVCAQERAQTPAARRDKSKSKGARKATPSPKNKRKTKRSGKAPANDARKLLAGQAQGNSEAKPESKPDAPAAASIADDASIHSEGATDVKTIEFTGLSIEGQLKTPQMLFFLNRLRAEFDRPRLPHRSFIPELTRARESKEL